MTAKPDEHSSRTEDSVDPVAKIAPQLTETVLPPLPSWAEQVPGEAGVTKAELTRVLANGAWAAELESAWRASSKPLTEVVAKRSRITGRISKERQRAGQFQLFTPEQRLPDADASKGEYLTYGYENNPNGKLDLVRVIRILPGDDAEFDAIRQEEVTLMTLRRDAMMSILRTYVKK